MNLLPQMSILLLAAGLPVSTTQVAEAANTTTSSAALSCLENAATSAGNRFLCWMRLASPQQETMTEAEKARLLALALPVLKEDARDASSRALHYAAFSAVSHWGLLPQSSGDREMILRSISHDPLFSAAEKFERKTLARREEK